MQETLPHAIARMRAQGFNDHQIAGQIHHWHEGWSPIQISAVMDGPAHVTTAQKTYHGTSTHPFYPGQKPDHFQPAGRGGGIPVYAIGKGTHAAPPALQTALGAPAAGQSVEQSQAALGRVYKQNHPLGQGIISGVADLVPGVATAKGLRDSNLGVGAVASDASWLLGPAGKAAGLIGGFRALRGGLKAATALEDVGKAASVGEDVGKAAEAASKLPDARAQLRKGLKSAPSRYGVQKAVRSQELKDRVKTAEHALATISDPHEAQAAASAALRGKYTALEFKGFNEMTPETLSELKAIAQRHPTLGTLTRFTVMKALDKAAAGGMPTPSEVRKLQLVFGKEKTAGILSQAGQNIGDKVLNVLNIPRSLQATADVSGLGRQNLVAGASHPLIWGKNFPKAFKAAASGEYFDTEAQRIATHPLYLMALEAGVQFTDVGEHAPLAMHEEGFASDYATHIPIFGRIVKGSARAYVTTGNAMKMDVFANRIRLGLKAGQNVEDPETLHQIAQVINAATGRGTLPGRAEHLLPAMNTFMFSPRLMLARLQYFDPTWYYRLKGPARREALRGLFATAGGVTLALYTFSRIPGVTVDWQHPQSADWGKLKIGNTRIDIAGGFQQYVRLASELATNTEISSTTGKRTTLGSGYGVPTRLDVLENFGINKLAPAPGLAVNLARGHNAVGTPLTWNSLAQNYLTPLVFQDAKDIYNEKHGGVDGITLAFGAYGLGALGAGLQTYTPKPSKTSGSSDPFDSSPGSSSGDPFDSSGSSGDPFDNVP